MQIKLNRLSRPSKTCRRKEGPSKEKSDSWITSRKAKTVKLFLKFTVSIDTDSASSLMMSMPIRDK